MNTKINIAIDGHSSCGKSTMTKQIAEKLDYIYIDTGAMYRAVTFYFLENKIDLTNKDAIKTALQNITLNFAKNTDSNINIQINGNFVEEEIRSMRVSNHVSEVAAIKEVRKFLVKEQQQIATQKGVVMDGRDIGTVVLPNAEVKFFVTADKQVRAQRRYDELLAKGKDIALAEVLKNLEHRDYVDSHRADSPLKKAEDAILIDNTNLTRQEQFELALSFIEKQLNK